MQSCLDLLIICATGTCTCTCWHASSRAKHGHGVASSKLSHQCLTLSSRLLSHMLYIAFPNADYKLPDSLLLPFSMYMRYGGHSWTQAHINSLSVHLPLPRSHHNSAPAGQLPEDVGVPQAVQQHARQQVSGPHVQRPQNHAQQHDWQEALHAEVRPCKAQR